MNFGGAFRYLFIVLLLGAFWLRYRAAKVRPFQDEEEDGLQEAIAFILATLADGAAFIFGMEYVLSGDLFTFAYELAYPIWLRSLGVVVGLAGLLLLLWSGVHLRGDRAPDDARPASEPPVSGPYRWIRHPVYGATLLTYVGVGLLSSNWVLTFVPPLLHLAAMLRKIPREERLLQESMGARDVSYMQRTGMIFPFVSELLNGGDGGDEVPPGSRGEPRNHVEEKSSMS